MRRNKGILEVRQQILEIRHQWEEPDGDTETQLHEARAGERQEETVEGSLEGSRKLEPPWKASQVSVGTAHVLSEHIEERVDLD